MDLLYLKGNHKLWLLSRPRSRACLESYLEGKKHILKKQNPNFVFSKKKKAWFVKILALKNYFLEMKQKNMVKKWIAKLTGMLFLYLQHRIFESPYKQEFANCD